jgi:protein phosphatase-4 regulatory subunit 3
VTLDNVFFNLFAQRMKFYVIRTRVLSHVLKFLRPETKAGLSGERCVKLAALRFLRSILAVKDEFYNRHIVQHNLFAPVFETFRTNPIGDNLVASSIVEMCDFITKENIKSLMEYIVTKHLHPPKVRTADESRSLEDVAKPYVDTLTRLRTQYEESNNSQGCSVQCSVDDKIGKLSSEKAIEDQVCTNSVPHVFE